MNILISGAGIAGLTLAYWLKQQGFTPTLVEKHRALRKGGYKVDVRGTALEVARRMGIYQELIEANVNIKRSQFVTPDLKIFRFEEDILGYTSETDIEIHRWDLTQILAKAVGQIETVFDDSITKIEERRVYFEKGEPREFDLVIGADGLRSKVRRLCFGEDSQFVREYGVHFCIFPIPNLFDLDRSEIVYFEKGKLVSAYAVNGHSFACLAFKAKEGKPSRSDLKNRIAEALQHSGWEIPRLIALMKESSDCYFDTTAQVRMETWSKGRVALVGDAGYAASGIGTSFAMVGAYVLARELGKANGNYADAFLAYEKSMQTYVEMGQELSESHHEILSKGDSSWLIKWQLYAMKMLPGKFIRFFTKRGRRQMHKVAHAISLDSI